MKGSRLVRYLLPLAAELALGILFLVDPSSGRKAAQVTLFSFKEMLLVIPPIFVLLGLLDVWVPREKMVIRRSRCEKPLDGKEQGDHIHHKPHQEYGEVKYIPDD